MTPPAAGRPGDVSKPAFSPGLAFLFVFTWACFVYYVMFLWPAFFSIAQSMQVPLPRALGWLDAFHKDRLFYWYLSLPILWFAAYWLWDRERRRRHAGRWTPEQVTAVGKTDRLIRGWVILGAVCAQGVMGMSIMYVGWATATSASARLARGPAPRRSPRPPSRLPAPASAPAPSEALERPAPPFAKIGVMAGLLTPASSAYSSMAKSLVERAQLLHAGGETDHARALLDAGVRAGRILAEGSRSGFDFGMGMGVEKRSLKALQAHALASGDVRLGEKIRKRLETLASETLAYQRWAGSRGAATDRLGADLKPFLDHGLWQPDHLPSDVNASAEAVARDLLDEMAAFRRWRAEQGRDGSSVGP